MKSIKTALALATCAFLVTGGNIASVNAQSVPADMATTTASADDEQKIIDNYLLESGDRLSLTVFGEADLTKELQVGPDGTLDIPLIGSVDAKGLTVNVVRSMISQRLSDGYIRNPNVTLAIISFRPFFILGEVNKPGQYPYRKGLTMQGAIATAEGYTYRARKKWVIIKHENEAEEVRVEMTPSLMIRPGDTIRVTERHF